jgi:hypothetical protein
VYQTYLPLREEFLALAKSGKKKEAMTRLRTTGSKTVARLDEVIEGLKNQKIEDGLATYESNASMGESALTMMLSAIGLAVALAISLVSSSPRIANRSTRSSRQSTRLSGESGNHQCNPRRRRHDGPGKEPGGKALLNQKDDRRLPKR